ncbi:hypothetical protein OH76DRAFT_524882 [Lentinus brumalis]|uniref:Uncharacterized protein n=1 Tax=Lentinus brumalis TaxID=2498619 RepID=A0A371CHP6_9APHY|nr:hypothetical protein OH76DRAFT_524882 [Polyporus brumalis]
MGDELGARQRRRERVHQGWEGGSERSRRPDRPRSRSCTEDVSRESLAFGREGKCASRLQCTFVWPPAQVCVSGLGGDESDAGGRESVLPVRRWRKLRPGRRHIVDCHCQHRGAAVDEKRDPLSATRHDRREERLTGHPNDEQRYPVDGRRPGEGQGAGPAYTIVEPPAIR